MIKLTPEQQRATYERLQKIVNEARGRSTAELTIEWCDAVLRSPLRIPPLPQMAELHTKRMADVKRDPRLASKDETHGRQRRWQYERWLDDVTYELRTHGLSLLVALEKYAPGDIERFNAVSGRISTLLRSLRALDLTWWPTFEVDSSHKELSLLDHCEIELGRLDTRDIRRRGGSLREVML